MPSRTLLVTGAATALTAVAGSLAARPGQDRWYQRLRKPAFQPPPVAFPIVWSALYADVAVSAATTIDAYRTAGRYREADRYAAALGVNLALNAGWTWLFFRGHRPLWATAECAALAVSGADLVRRSATVSRPAAGGLAVYAGWCGFATVLSGTIAWLNRPQRAKRRWPRRR